jgi:glutamine amidotransferase
VCRHLVYLGSPVRLAELVLDRPHALLRQSWAPSDMRGGGTVNADGFGVGWYPDGASGPVRYRRAAPLWTDSGFAELAGSVSAGAVLAAVRSATVGMPVIDTACAPFTDGHWLFSHNGLVRGWPESMAGPAAELPVTDLLTLDAPTDSAVLWALLRRDLAAGRAPEAALAGLVERIGALAPDSRLNLALTDGTTAYLTAWYHSLSVLATGDTTVVASEPWDDDPQWTAIPDRTLVVATRHEVRTTELAKVET